MAMDTDSNPVHPFGGEGRDGPAHRRWTVLFIGDHGKVIAFKRIKTVIALTLAVLVVALAAVAVLLVVNQGLHGRGRDLQQRLEESRRQIESLESRERPADGACGLGRNENEGDSLRDRSAGGGP